LLFQAGDGRLGVSLCNQASMTSLAAKLRRLRDLAPAAKPARLVLLRDARLPISAGAQKSRNYLAELAKQGTRLLRPTAEAMAALEALRGLLSDAKAGDLAHRGETVEPRTVEEWLTAHRDPSLAALGAEVFSAPAPGGDPPPRDPDLVLDELLELLGERHVIALQEAAERLGHTVGELERCVRDHAGAVGVLSRPRAVLFQRANDRTGGESSPAEGSGRDGGGAASP
jgi:hypothetical protein